MSKKKLSAEQIEELRQVYESWNPYDPDSPTAAELAAQFGISKQTLYTLRSEWRREDRPNGKSAEDDEDLHGVIRYLTEQLVEARIRIRELERSAGED